MINKEKAISEIIENFNFERVHKVMEFLNWTWWDSENVPTIGGLVLSAQSRLSETFDRCNSLKENTTTGSGGFFVRAEYNEKEGGCDYLKLTFQLNEWEYYEE